MRLDLPLVLEIALVGHHHHGEVVLVLDLDRVSSSKPAAHRDGWLDGKEKSKEAHPQDLLVECRYLLERAPRGDRVDEQEPFA